MFDLGLLVSRVALGGGIAAHGAQKAFGSFEGPGPQGAARFMQSLGFSPGERFAAAAAWSELAGGALIVLGAGGPIGPAAVISTMVVAQTAGHAKNGFFAQRNGIELGVMYAAGALALASAGYGRLSCDELFGWQKLREPWLTAAAIVGSVAAGCLVLAQRSASDMPPSPSVDGTDTARAQETAGESLTAAHDDIAAAQEDRPVPADLLAGTGEQSVAQP